MGLGFRVSGFGFRVEGGEDRALSCLHERFGLLAISGLRA